MSHLACFAHLRRRVEPALNGIATLAAIATAAMLLGASLPARAQTGADVFASLCFDCHNGTNHPANLVYNAAGNADIIETLIALGMDAKGSAADHASIATYLDSAKPTITLAKVPHNSPGTDIKLGDITVSGSEEHHYLQIISNIVTVSPPTKGTVSYAFAIGFNKPSIVTYTPFFGQSGTDTWTYQGIGPHGNTTIRTASVDIAPGVDVAPANYQGLWWNPLESGWGINFAHQGNIVFATWYTYDTQGKPWWLIAQLNKADVGIYSGPVSKVTGPPFNAVPFPSEGTPGGAIETIIGNMSVDFEDAGHATMSYFVNGTSQTKSIVPIEFGTRPVCTWGFQPDLTLATNYQGLWWNAPGASESGWGINFAHQGEIIFATWFTYDDQGQPWWLIAQLNKSAAGVYSGAVSTLTGPPFNSIPFPPENSPGGATETVVGTATVTFADGNDAAFAYTVNGVSQTKQITRIVFVSPGTVCN